MMKLVDCTEEHWEFVRKLRTDKNNSIWFYTQIEITPSQQKIFMENNSYKYKICLLVIILPGAAFIPIQEAG